MFSSEPLSFCDSPLCLTSATRGGLFGGQRLSFSSLTPSLWRHTSPRNLPDCECMQGPFFFSRTCLSESVPIPAFTLLGHLASYGIPAWEKIDPHIVERITLIFTACRVLLRGTDIAFFSVYFIKLSDTRTSLFCLGFLVVLGTGPRNSRCDILPDPIIFRS